MSYTPEYRAMWTALRPGLPMPIVDGVITATSLEMLIDPNLWVVKRDDTMWHMNQPSLCGFFLPPFQRPLVWDEARMVAFVESAYLGIHLGTIVYNNTMDAPLTDGKFDRTDRWLIDGQQRCNALWNYANDAFPVFVGTPHEHRYSELNVIEQRTFGRIQIGVTKLTSTDETELRRVYDRLNFGGVAHTEDQRALPA